MFLFCFPTLFNVEWLHSYIPWPKFQNLFCSYSKFKKKRSDLVKVILAIIFFRFDFSFQKYKHYLFLDVTSLFVLRFLGTSDSLHFSHSSFVNLLLLDLLAYIWQGVEENLLLRILLYKCFVMWLHEVPYSKDKHFLKSHLENIA